MTIGNIITRGLLSGGGVNALIDDGLAAYTGLPESLPLGFLMQTYTGGGAGDWLGDGASPAVQVGDVFIVGETQPGGYVVVPNPDGTVTVMSGGDPSRQFFAYQLFRVASNFREQGIAWIDEIGPTWANPVVLLALLPQAPIVPFTVADPAYASSIEGDDLVFTIASGALPAGITMDPTGLFSGAPVDVGSASFTILATDSTGTSTESGACLITCEVPLMVHSQKFTRHRGKTLVVLPFEDFPDMTPAERAEQVRLDALREDMQGVFSGNQAVLQAHVNAYRAEQQRIQAMSMADKQVDNLFRKLQLQ